MKVAIIWNFLFHYRIPLYRRLGRVPGVDLTGTPWGPGGRRWRRPAGRPR